MKVQTNLPSPTESELTYRSYRPFLWNTHRRPTKESHKIPCRDQIPMSGRENVVRFKTLVIRGANPGLTMPALPYIARPEV